MRARAGNLGVGADLRRPRRDGDESKEAELHVKGEPSRYNFPKLSTSPAKTLLKILMLRVAGAMNEWRDRAGLHWRFPSVVHQRDDRIGHY
jgi:hypothetical protein